MYAKYGSYQHTDNLTGLTRYANTRTFGSSGVETERTWTIGISGELISTEATASAAQADLKTKMDALRTAYDTHGQDFALYHDNGTISGLSLLSESTSSEGAVQVVDFAFAADTPSAYASQMPFAITLSRTDTVYSGITDLMETVTITGTGGPRSIFIETLKGSPQEQTVNQKTVQRITQQGRIVGNIAHALLELLVPQPIFAGERAERRQRRLVSPKRRNGVLVDYAIDYSYFFESATPQTGYPATP